MKNWTKYSFEFLSIFIAVVTAFALNNWNDNRRDRKAESKILTEIYNGLKKDLEDVKLNVHGHQEGIKAVDFFKTLLTRNDTVLTDSVLINYYTITRDFFSVQNTSGYEALKSKGLELIENDSLRTKVISLYEIDYTILKQFEEEYYEKQFQENYFHEINHFLAPNFQFDDSKNITGLKLPLEISENDEKIFLIDLWKIKLNRMELLSFYDNVEKNINDLKNEIKNELAK